MPSRRDTGDRIGAGMSCSPKISGVIEMRPDRRSARSRGPQLRIPAKYRQCRPMPSMRLVQYPTPLEQSIPLVQHVDRLEIAIVVDPSGYDACARGLEPACGIRVAEQPRVSCSEPAYWARQSASSKISRDSSPLDSEPNAEPKASTRTNCGPCNFARAALPGLGPTSFRCPRSAPTRFAPPVRGIPCPSAPVRDSGSACCVPRVGPDSRSGARR